MSLSLEIIDVKQIVSATQFLNTAAIVDGNFLQDSIRWIKNETVNTRSRHLLVGIVIGCQAPCLHNPRLVEVKALLSDIQFDQTSVPSFVVFNGIQFLCMEPLNVSDVLAHRYRKGIVNMSLYT